MAQAQRYRLKLKRLDFLSAVDAGAQGPIANAVLLKRAGNDKAEITGKFQVAKVEPKLGLVFGWAFASSLDGGATPHTDLQQDQIDGDFLKVALDFMEGGAATDVMHDGDQDGRVVFAFPLLPDICKALGIATKTVGLAVAIKPSAETFKRYEAGELAAFSIGGVGEREPIAKAGVKKQSLYTTEALGHQHTLDVCDDDYCCTSYQTAEGADDSHSHRWVRGADGTIMILADSGHTHELAPDQASVIVVPADAVVVVAARAAQASASKSTLAAPVPHGDDMKLVVLTESQHAHYSKLAGDDADAFIAKTANERDAIVKAALDADPVVYKTASGLEIRKSAGEVAVQLAKQSDEQAKTIAAQTLDITKAREERETAILKGRATTELVNGPGTVDTKVALLKAVGSIPDEPTRTAVTEAIKGMHAACTNSTVLKGSNEGDVATGAAAQLKTAVEEYAKANNIEHYAVAFAKATASDPKVRELYAAAQAERN